MGHITLPLPFYLLLVFHSCFLMTQTHSAHDSTELNMKLLWALPSSVVDDSKCLNELPRLFHWHWLMLDWFNGWHCYTRIHSFSLEHWIQYLRMDLL